MANEHKVRVVENEDSGSVEAWCEQELVGKVCGSDTDGWTVAEWSNGVLAPRQPAKDRDSALGRLVRLVLARGLPGRGAP